jgi:hypothetical protein
MSYQTRTCANCVPFILLSDFLILNQIFLFLVPRVCYRRCQRITARELTGETLTRICALCFIWFHFVSFCFILFSFCFILFHFVSGYHEAQRNDHHRDGVSFGCVLFHLVSFRFVSFGFIWFHLVMFSFILFHFITSPRPRWVSF